MSATPPYMNSSALEWEGAFLEIITAADTAYIMRAVAGTTTGESVWQIKKYYNDGTTKRITYAEGSVDFKFTATSYLAYSYT